MDLISLPVEMEKEKIDSRFRLVLAVSKRARGLTHGAMPKIASRSKKMITVALEEVVSGAVRVLSGEAAIKAREEADKLRNKDMIDEAEQKASLPEELTKFEKELHAFLKNREEVGEEHVTPP